MLTPTPADTAAPQVRLDALPRTVRASDGLKVIAAATDDTGVVRMALLLDGTLLHQSQEATLRHNLDTRVLQPGDHRVLVQAWDAAGNCGEAVGVFALAPDATPAPSVTPEPSASATAWPSPTRLASTAQPTPEPVTAFWSEISIATYGYRQALYTDPEGTGQPYPLLHREQVSGPVSQSYRVLVLRNEYLELVLLPELGGRIYQCRFLPTGQNMLYNNRVIKPTQWGPADQGWWLAVGGIEFCLPVDEHGYVTAEPWDTDWQRGADGSATAVMRITERSRNLRAEVRVTLRPGEAGFGLRTILDNPDAAPKSYQYWVNALLSPGAHGVQPSLRFYYPTDSVLVHSRGDGALPEAGQALPWPLYDGRDLSVYGTWRNWLGFFATELRSNYTAVYDSVARAGMVRTFPAELAPGAKLFGFGQGFDPGIYTDDGTQYVEMWGGVTPTFWDYATLESNGRRQWDEYWYVLAGVDGL
ncbi:MAG: DUF5107 domain-containing protein, partial [Chloroflexi bacterium]|nr:DUF5107 domain-containing protein [Chloroflexota bacterium]